MCQEELAKAAKARPIPPDRKKMNGGNSLIHPRHPLRLFSPFFTLAGSRFRLPAPVFPASERLLAAAFADAAVFAEPSLPAKFFDMLLKYWVRKGNNSNIGDFRHHIISEKTQQVPPTVR
jgi:hypothetical protein